VVIVVLLWDYCGHCHCESTAVTLRLLLWSMWSLWWHCGHYDATVIWWHCGHCGGTVVAPWSSCGHCGGTVVVLLCRCSGAVITVVVLWSMLWHFYHCGAPVARSSRRISAACHPRVHGPTIIVASSLKATTVSTGLSDRHIHAAHFLS
jgi:hypothetical protein